jgi:hypothetical protein
VEPGQSVSHPERWYLLNEIPQPPSLRQREVAEWIAPLLQKVGLELKPAEI